jgi:hypothetical protein
MGRQINFYMSETVLAELIEFLKQNQFVYYDYCANKVDNVADKKLYTVYLYKENYGVFLRNKSDSRYIDFMDGPVIEFSKSMIDAETKKLIRGRLWMDGWYFDEAGNKVKKSELLTKDYEKLVRWVKKHVPYQEYEQKGYILKEYINDEVIELQKQGYTFNF